jgi:hypothetical protein
MQWTLMGSPPNRLLVLLTLIVTTGLGLSVAGASQKTSSAKNAFGVPCPTCWANCQRASPILTARVVLVLATIGPGCLQVSMQVADLRPAEAVRMSTDC